MDVTALSMLVLLPELGRLTLLMEKRGSRPRYVYAYSNNICFMIYCRQAKSMPARQIPPVDWKLVGRRLRELRGFDTNQQAFAKQIGVSQGQLSRYEDGKTEIGAEVLLRIAHLFDKSIEWLLTGKR